MKMRRITKMITGQARVKLQAKIDAKMKRDELLARCAAGALCSPREVSR